MTWPILWAFPPIYTYNATAGAPPATISPNPRIDGEWVLYVFDGCKAAKRGNAPEVPIPAFWLNRLKLYYGVDVSQHAYDTLTTGYFHVSKYTGYSNVACWGAADFNSPNKDCGCNADFLAAWNKFIAADPSSSSKSKRTKNNAHSTAACYSLLSATPDVQELRAALAVCEEASAWNAGTGVDWNFAGVATFLKRPLTKDELDVTPALGQTSPEFVFKNEHVCKLGAISMSMGMWVDPSKM